jgi:uncharacterized protein
VATTTDPIHTIEYPYTRTTGAYLGPFLTALRDGRLLGNRIAGKVYCPPLEYDPDNGEPASTEMVEVGPGGTVVGFTWVTEPSTKHPVAHPFAFALVQLDGADVPMVHAVDVGPGASADAVSVGMRVAAQYRDERSGAITDVVFVPESAAQPQVITPGDDPVLITTHLISLQVKEPLFPHRKRFADGLLAGKIIGQRSPVSGKVSVPGRGYDNLERVVCTEADDVVVSDRGTVATYTIITPVRYYGQKETEPYIRCSVLLDGSDSPIMGVDVRDIPPEEFKIGLRLQAIWRPVGERDLSDLDNRFGGSWEGVIARWERTGEPDVDPELMKDHNF